MNTKNKNKYILMGEDAMLTREDYQRVVEISHELNGILKRNTLDAIELHIKDGLVNAKIPEQEMFIMQGKNYKRATGWAKNPNGSEDGYEDFLNKNQGLI